MSLAEGWINFTLLILVVDRTPPFVFGCPDDILRIIERGEATFLAISWNPPFANDPNPPVTTSSTHDPGDDFFIGSTPVVYTFRDLYENAVNCTFVVDIVESKVDFAYTIPNLAFCD